jgi:hypothetical protein
MQEEVAKRNNLYDKYEDFDTLFLPSVEFGKALIKVIKEHNRGRQEKPILIFFKKPLKMVAAAVTIQTAFRHYLWRRQQSPYERFAY